MLILEELFCDLDDFCQSFEPRPRQSLQVGKPEGAYKSYGKPTGFISPSPTRCLAMASAINLSRIKNPYAKSSNKLERDYGVQYLEYSVFIAYICHHDVNFDIRQVSKPDLAFESLTNCLGSYSVAIEIY